MKGNSIDKELLAAVLAGDINLIRSLIEQGADVNVADKRGRTSLDWSAHKGRLDICELLLDNGADVNAMDDYDITPMHQAASYSRTETCKLLKEHGGYISEIYNISVMNN